MPKDYWVDRNLKAQQRVSDKSVEEIEKQLVRYYSKTAQRIMSRFEDTYEKVLKTVGDGRQPTPADLYKLDTYWMMVAQTKVELEKLGNSQHKLFFKRFRDTYINVYNALAIPGERNFNTIDTKAAEQMINSIWCADGKNWSSRIWKNTENLQQTLNDKLIECLVSGRKTTDLKQTLQESFGVSYKQADRLVRTEIAHIQTSATQKKYQDCGFSQVEVYADYDERRCDVCGKLHGKKYPVFGALPIPAHSNCRCCIIPVVENKK